MKLAKVGGVPILVSGFHRLNAAKAARRQSILAEVYDIRPQELLWAATEENLKHGLPMKAREYRTVFRAYVQAGRYRTGNNGVKSSRAIAADLNGIVSHTTVVRWMRSQFPAIYRKMTSDEDRPPGKGGLPEVRVPTEEQVLLNSALDALAQLRAAVPGITSPEARGHLIEPLKAVLMAMDEKTAVSPDF